MNTVSIAWASNYNYIKCKLCCHIYLLPFLHKVMLSATLWADCVNMAVIFRCNLRFKYHHLPGRFADCELIKRTFMYQLMREYNFLLPVNTGIHKINCTCKVWNVHDFLLALITWQGVQYNALLDRARGGVLRRVCTIAHHFHGRLLPGISPYKLLVRSTI